MTTDKGIFIQNIYYMLSYAYQVLQQQDYQCIASEKFEHIDDLFAAILAKGVSRQLKQGLYREYVSRSETRSVLRGKLDLPQTIKTRIQQKPQVACTFDELSEDNLYNQILKTTLQVLLRDENVSAARKVELKKVLLFLDTVSVLLPSQIPWKQLHYQRSNQNYEMLLNLCYFVLHDMLQTTENGSYKMTAFSDERMAKLYERFILEYYRKHHTYLTEVKAAQVKWDLVGEHDAAMLRFLPAMQTDIFLRFHEKILILDAKYYSQTLQQRFNKETLHSANLYQIYTYVKNQDAAHTGKRFRAAGLRQNAGSHHPGLSLQLGRQPDRCTHLGSQSGFPADHRTAGWNRPAIFREASALIFSMSIYRTSGLQAGIFFCGDPKNCKKLPPKQRGLLRGQSVFVL